MFRENLSWFKTPWFSKVKCCQRQLIVGPSHGHRVRMTPPDSKVCGANMGITWGRQDPGGPHVGPINLAIWACMEATWQNVRLLYYFHLAESQVFKNGSWLIWSLLGVWKRWVLRVFLDVCSKCRHHVFTRVKRHCSKMTCVWNCVSKSQQAAWI